MFNGSWKESNEAHITLEIPDENIDVEGKESLKIIFISSSVSNMGDSVSLGYPNT